MRTSAECECYASKNIFVDKWKWSRGGLVLSLLWLYIRSPALERRHYVQREFNLIHTQHHGELCEWSLMMTGSPMV